MRPEIEVLDRMGGDTIGGAEAPARQTVGHYLVQIAKLGGYLVRAKDPRRATWCSGAGSLGSPISSWASN
jgi:hypothetical protein